MGHLCFGLGAEVRSLGPKLGELFGMSAHNVCVLNLGLAGPLFELGLEGQHRGLRVPNGSLCGRLRGVNSCVESRTLGLQGTNLGSQCC